MRDVTPRAQSHSVAGVDRAALPQLAQRQRHATSMLACLVALSHGSLLDKATQDKKQEASRTSGEIAAEVKRLEAKAFKLLETDTRYANMKTKGPAKEELRVKAAADRVAAGELFETALRLDPFSANSLVQVGLRDKDNEDKAVKEHGIELLERAFGPNVSKPVPIDSMQGWQLATWIFQHRWKQNSFRRAWPFLQKAVGSRFALENNDDCQRLQLATMLSTHPESVDDAAAIVAGYSTQMDALLSRPLLDVSKTQNPDVYVYCLFPAFPLVLYYEADMAALTTKFHEVAAKAFPELRYVSPHLARPMQRACAADGARVRIGIASAFFNANSSVLDEYGATLSRLPRDTIEVVYIYLQEKSWQVERPSPFLDAASKEDKKLLVRNAPGWLETARKDIAALELDMLLYVDLTVSSMAQRLAMGRLAPVQATSFGHPVTSGLPRHVVNHYVSWGAAELPDAQRHYTEELVLLPSSHMHLYHERRVHPASGVSTVDGKAWRHLTRADFSMLPTKHWVHGQWRRRHWYVCVQKPYKLHPAFDAMLVGIMVNDPDAIVVLHDIDFGARDVSVDTDLNRQLVKRRMAAAGVDVGRVFLLPALQHNKLLALSSLADVVLDSYYAGGSTETREALEAGALMPTLPAKYLGSRFGQAYYNIMGVTDLIAQDADDYVRIAVRIATDLPYAAELRQRIADNLHKLFESNQAVRAWTETLLRLAMPPRR